MTPRCPRLAVLFGAAALACGASALAQPQERGRIEQGVFVPEGNTLAEVLEQRAANQAQAEAARRQTAENQARQAASAQARAAYEAELARLEQERISREAEAARLAAEHEAAMARWRADVAACEAGDEKRCAPAADD